MICYGAPSEIRPVSPSKWADRPVRSQAYVNVKSPPFIRAGHMGWRSVVTHSVYRAEQRRFDSGPSLQQRLGVRCAPFHDYKPQPVRSGSSSKHSTQHCVFVIHENSICVLASPLPTKPIQLRWVPKRHRCDSGRATSLKYIGGHCIFLFLCSAGADRNSGAADSRWRGGWGQEGNKQCHRRMDHLHSTAADLLEKLAGLRK